MKRTVRYFVSYAHADQTLAVKLLAQLKKQFGASKGYEFVLWRDNQILPGEKWHAEIQDAIQTCDFGLLLVSPAFLSSDYIDQHELLQFLNGERTCIPVGLCRIDFANHDLKGLEELQLFRYQSEGADEPRVFEDYTTVKLQSDFALALFRQIKARLDKVSAGDAREPAHRVPRTSIPHNLPSLQPFFGREDELAKVGDALDPESRGWGALSTARAAWARPPSPSAPPTTFRPMSSKDRLCFTENPPARRRRRARLERLYPERPDRVLRRSRPRTRPRGDP